jgi:hypothetical protein
MIEIGTRETQRPFPFHSEEASLSKFLATLGAD